jgi:hypothetical protein
LAGGGLLPDFFVSVVCVVVVDPSGVLTLFSVFVLVLSEQPLKHGTTAANNKQAKVVFDIVHIPFER